MGQLVIVPTGPTSALGDSNWPTTGAANAWTAVATADGDTSYIQSNAFAEGAFLTGVRTGLPTDAIITNVVLTINAKSLTGTKQIYPLLSDTNGTTYFTEFPTINVTTSYTNLTSTATLDFNSNPMTRANIIGSAADAIYLFTDATTGIRISHMYYTINYTSVSESPSTNAPLFAGD